MLTIDQVSRHQPMDIMVIHIPIVTSITSEDANYVTDDVDINADYTHKTTSYFNQTQYNKSIEIQIKLSLGQLLNANNNNKKNNIQIT